MDENRSKNLILIADRQVSGWETFEKIAGHVREFAPDIKPVLMHPKKPNLLARLLLPRRPTMVFSGAKLPLLCRGLPGTVVQGGALPKSEELKRLEQHGFPVPRWTTLTRTSMPDLSGFGPYVVIKPEYGRRGADIRIMKRGRVRWIEPRTRQASVRNNSWVVQDFIYTGKWPVSYRITTLFGEVLWSWCVAADRKRSPLQHKYGFSVHGKQGGGITIVSGGKGCGFKLNYDQEIISLAEKVHSAFPELPVLGVDIIREEPDGRLFVLEVNSSGYTLHFTTRMGLSIQKLAGFNLDSQFDGIRKAGRILAEQTRIKAS